MVRVLLFNKWSIRTKILAGFLSIAALAAVGGFINARGVGEMNDAFQSIADRATPAFLALHSMDASAHDMALVAITIVLSDDPPEVFDTNISAFETTVQEVEFAHDIYKNTRVHTEVFDEELNLKKRELYLSALSIVNAKKERATKEVLLGMIPSLRLRAEAFSEDVDIALTHEEEKVVTQKAHASAIGSKVLTTAVIFGVLETLLAVLIGLFIANYIGRPLKHLQEVAEDLTRGEFGRLIPVRSDDEIGRLAQTFNKMTMHVQRAQLEAEEKVREQATAMQKENEQLKEK